MARSQTAYAVRRTARGLARAGAGLALAAVVAACGAGQPDGALGRQAEYHRSAADAPSPAPSQYAAPFEVLLVEPEPTEHPAPGRTEDAAPEPEDIGDDWGLRIPAIDVETPVVDLTMTADRALVPPSDPGLVGWWSEGAGPGDDEGSVVVVGHSVSTGGGAFDDIAELSSGDTIHIEHLDYRVQSVEVMSKPDLARRAEEIFNQSVPERLVLITCEDWDGETWRSNAVAIATPY